MSDNGYARAAVAAATGFPVESLRVAEDDETRVCDPNRRWWDVDAPRFGGLDDLDAPPRVWIVSPARRDSQQAAVWVAELPGERWLRLNSADGLTAVLAAIPNLEGETIARVVAANLAPAGAEYVIADEKDVGIHLDELAAEVPPKARPLTFVRVPDGGWTLGFLSVVQHQSAADRTHRITAARWEVDYARGSGLRWRRTELVSEALLERYRLR